MKMKELEIKGAWLATSPIHRDDRGHFREWFKATTLRNHASDDFEVMQANLSVSQKEVIRGIHYSLVMGGQSKWITCVAGSIWDVIVDIRPTSPTYKKWISVDLNADSGDSILISAGLGHAFMALEDDSIVSYLLSSPYSPSDEYEISPLDTELGIKWPAKNPVLSGKDSAAKTLRQMQDSGKLPS